MRIAVAGGTGAVGRHVVEVARERGHEVLVLARSAGVDLVTGEGLDLAGVDAVVDASSVRTASADTSTRFFEAVTRTLLATPAPHLVALSIVGCDVVDMGYYEGKRRQEELVLADPRGTVLRATQFHEFAGQMLERTRKGPFILAPRMRSQPVAAREVGEALVDLAEGPPVGRAEDLAGPDEHDMADLIRKVKQASRIRGLLVPVALPGAVGKQIRAGGLLPTGPGARGKQTFDEWLAR
ncbi:SDR family oxidoreductase [Actinokineospora pegani]|uniref:SDR family oxidoreductase n=1 Tax=Actinokineospora pegani TaxID=2654637 RepID=UPI0012E9C219|nr:SDR family oxidoreductase [Actinokineospora pegani]